MDLGRVGIWSFWLRSRTPAARSEIPQAAAELEQLGYGAIWLGGSPGVRHAEPLLEATSTLVVATGILNIWQYNVAGVAAACAALPPAHRERFLLGLGVSHQAFNQTYQRPMAAMADYLDGLDAAGRPAPRVLAALGPQMLELSRDRAVGAHPYLVTPQHTRWARQVLGTGPLLAPEVKVLLETEPERARAVARQHLAMYLRLPNYTNNLGRLGFTQDDLRGGGSDRLVDAVVAWGSVDTVVERVAEHHEAGADHVCLQALGDDQPRQVWRTLATALDLAG